MSLTYEDVQEILKIIDQSSTREIHIEVDDFKLIVRKHDADGAPAVATPAAPPATASEPPAASPAPSAAAAAELPAAAESAPPSDTAVALASPLSGTFYRAPAPGADPFVEEGDAVKSSDTVCILDVMKVMNTLKAPCDGVVSHIPVENAQAVGAGQPVMWFEPR